MAKLDQYQKQQVKFNKDIAASRAAGLSYGQYMATLYDATTLPKSVVIPEGVRHECAYCGKVFFRNDKYNAKYCSPECSTAMKYLKKRKNKTA